MLPLFIGLLVGHFFLFELLDFSLPVNGCTIIIIFMPLPEAAVSYASSEFLNSNR